MAAAHRAVIARLAGRPDESIALARRAEDGFAACDMGLHAAAVRMRRGAWLGGAEGAALLGEGRAWMLEQGVASPERMARTVIAEAAPRA
jgi:hypothetical protein